MRTARESGEEEFRRPDGAAVVHAGDDATDSPVAAKAASGTLLHDSASASQIAGQSLVMSTVLIDLTARGTSNVARPVAAGNAVDESPAGRTREGQEDALVNIRDPNFATAATRAPSQHFGLTEDEGRRFLRIISDSLLIERHHQLFVWLTGELREIVPHDVFISVWGNFAKGRLKMDVISSLPGVRTEQIAGCQLLEVVESAHALWHESGRQARVLRMDHALKINSCNCHVHASLRSMKSVLIHGVRDERGGYESLYMAFAAGPQVQGRCKDRFLSMVNVIVPQIDTAFRRVAAYPLDGGGARAPANGGNWLDLSTRERQILDGVCLGKKNVDIADELGISHFTVKNHIQRIFKKIGASNRTQAAAKYNQTVGKFRQQAE